MLEPNTSLTPSGLESLTLAVDPNEKVFMLIERDAAASDGSGPRRFQVMSVNRDGNLSSFVRDLGPVSVDLGEFVFPCMWEYSVAEAADVANMWREENGLKEKLDERAEKSTLVEDFLTLQEVKDSVRKNKTTFGAGQVTPTAQRTGYRSRK